MPVLLIFKKLYILEVEQLYFIYLKLELTWLCVNILKNINKAYNRIISMHIDTQ